MRRVIQVTKQRKEDATWNELICPPSHLLAGRLEGATCDNRIWVWGMDMKGNESGIGFFVRRISSDITMYYHITFVARMDDVIMGSLTEA